MLRFLARAALISSVALVAGCGGSTIYDTKSFDSDQALVTSADVRLVYKTRPESSAGGRITPQNIICSEPSPDVAKAVAESFNLGGSFGGGIPSGVSAEAAAAISLARAEGMAQLTQRLATIQLLRDGLYRACEAYANGAISDTTYAVMISRYDDTMVTMLMGELAAGNFSGRLAAIGTGAGGDASAQLNRATQRLLEASGQLADSAQPQSEAPSPQGGEGQTTRSVDQNTSSAMRAAANSIAEAAQLIAASSSGFRQNPQIAQTIATMQRKYIENINVDAMVVACINALDQGRIAADISGALAELQIEKDRYRNNYSDENRLRLRTAHQTFNQLMGDSLKSPLAAHCIQGVIPQIVEHQSMILDHILEESKIEDAVKVVKNDSETIFELLEPITKFTIDLSDLPAERAALKSKIELAREEAKSAREAARQQYNTADGLQSAAARLESDARTAGRLAGRAETLRDDLKFAYETAKQRSDDAAAEAKAAQDALTANADDEALKRKAERLQEIADRRAEEATIARDAYDKAEADVGQLRPKAETAQNAADDARLQADKAWETWRGLDRLAREMDADVDDLRAQL